MWEYIQILEIWYMNSDLCKLLLWLLLIQQILQFINFFVLGRALTFQKNLFYLKMMKKIPEPLSPFKHQPLKMVKHTQTIRRQYADELFECVWPFCGVDT